MKILKNNQIICNNVYLANNPIKRLIGLLGKKEFCESDGVLLCPCSQIHSFGMQFSFDAIYLDSEYKIIALYENIKKNRILPYKHSAKNVLELPLGTIKNKKLEPGDELKLIEA